MGERFGNLIVRHGGESFTLKIPESAMHDNELLQNAIVQEALRLFEGRVIESNQGPRKRGRLFQVTSRGVTAKAVFRKINGRWTITEIDPIISKWRNQLETNGSELCRQKRWAFTWTNIE
jgi:hypothetical protein